ncbi:SDR family NAD(P)-dependent oxidoreductase [Blastococcus sp. VKM Ac-2987]|uniref:SDR family NAD(P)-dependent oxidoreductase n=1 Tax=Blastococcus sp. VKM Ac-2987 TaxID=3004141 RepID=UPI0022ABAB21|nr:SDR family oxidoreductase [Blastococcus sp. VKM Ac-2987]MCZ2857242.1 SDR family NAD(P)-dependent oxidoreductase [Blastococcus sp. VKM Ac-2987]
MTGGASGIGRALGAALVRRGDQVVLTAVEGAAAARAAEELTAVGPGKAGAAAVDVRDAEAVAALVTDTAERYGRLDLMVNNAGVGIGGPIEELALAHWDRAVDVNLRGVVHGVHAAYPVMLRQGSGHIVNTASVAGLLPNPGFTPYATTKWAVVGLSLSLRGEAASRGVRVSVVCPGGVDTPMLDKGMPSDLPGVPTLETTDIRAVITRLSGGHLYSADALAADVLRGVDRNQAIIVAPRQARIMWRLMRLSPSLLVRLSAAMTARDSANGSAGPGQSPDPGQQPSRDGGEPDGVSRSDDTL